MPKQHNIVGAGSDIRGRPWAPHHDLLLGLDTLGAGARLPLELRRGGEVAQQLLQAVLRLVAKEDAQLALRTIVLRLQSHLQFYLHSWHAGRQRNSCQQNCAIFYKCIPKP